MGVSVLPPSRQPQRASRLSLARVGPLAHWFSPSPVARTVAVRPKRAHSQIRECDANGEHRVRVWRKRGLTCRRTRDRKPCRANRHGAIVSKHDHSAWHVPLHIAAVLTSWGGSRHWNVLRSRCQVLCSRRRNSDHASHSVHVPSMCRGKRYIFCDDTSKR